MNELVKLILSLSLSGAIIILVLFLWKPLIKNKLSKKWQYYIWLIAIGRLLLPFAPETNMMEVLFQYFDNVTMETDITFLQNQHNPILVEENIEGYKKNISNQEGSSNNNLAEEGLLPEQSLFELALENMGTTSLLIWLITAIGLLIRKITIYQSFVKYIMAGRIEISDMELWERVGRLLEQAGIKTAVGLYTNSLISSPLLIGLFRPCIMLPTAELPESDFQYTILHELMHYKRKDMFYKWLVQTAICLHWFNPLVLLMGREINRAGELSCDEAVIEHLDPEERRAYGDTLVNAIGIGGPYKASIGSIPLNESTVLLEERLNAIMGYKKKTKLTALISAALAVSLFFGAGAAGASGAPALPGFHVNMDKEVPSTRPGSYIEPQKAGNLKLVKKEYTISDLKVLDISGIVVEGLFEDISIKTGGKTLKLEYYTGKQDDYTLQTEKDSGGTFQELVLRRVNSAVTEGGEAPVTITIPDNINFRLISIETAGGNISLDNCSGRYVFCETQRGNITINKGMVYDMLTVRTDSGNALIMGTDLPDKNSGALFETNSGTIGFQPADKAENYHFTLDTGSKAQVSVNGKKYKGGEYKINNKKGKPIYFDSIEGSLIVQDLKKGKLSPEILDISHDTDVTGRQEIPVTDTELTMVTKKYTTKELKRLGITGLCIKAGDENIVVNQKGNSLILKYYQADSSDYSLGTRNYEIYHGEFTTPEDIAMNGGRSGTVKEVLLRRTDFKNPSDKPRTIYITLPSDPEYSRIVQLFCDSGNIRLNNCTSTAMLDAETISGNIYAFNCTSPLLGVGTKSGNMDVKGCTMKELNSMTKSGEFLLQLKDSAENYKMIIDAGTKSKISIKGKLYEGGEMVLNKNAPNKIYFDCYNGSLVITEKTKQ